MSEGAQLEVKSRYRKEFANYGMSMLYVRLARSRYAANATDVKAILMFQKQDALAKLTSPTTSAAVIDAETSDGYSSSSSAMTSDKVH